MFTRRPRGQQAVSGTESVLEEGVEGMLIMA